jgi:hypothetical protein
MIVKCDKDGMILMDQFILVWPALKNAVFYRIFPKKGVILVRFYDKKRRWIKNA